MSYLESTDHKFEEWQNARELMSKYDDRIHDVRKYGFSFVTALLTAQSILIPGNIKTADPISAFWIITGVLGVTLLLILALLFFENTYQLIQEAIAQRALILELNLNLGLTDTLSYQFKDKKVRIYEQGVYLVFVGATIALAFILLPAPFAFLLLGLASVIFYFIHRFKRTRTPHWSGTDWIMDRMEYKKGDIVKVTITNLNNKMFQLSEGEVLWKIRDQDLLGKCYEEKVKAPIKLKQYESYTWQWDTANVKTGVYRISPFGRNNFFLKRTIKVY